MTVFSDPDAKKQSEGYRPGLYGLYQFAFDATVSLVGFLSNPGENVMDLVTAEKRTTNWRKERIGWATADTSASSVQVGVRNRWGGGVWVRSFQLSIVNG